MSRITFTKAINLAMHEEMARDERVFCMGIDVTHPFVGRTTDLAKAFGDERVRDTPISELGFLGAAVGAAAAGMVPVVDLTAANFMYAGFDQLANQAGKLRYMMGGSASFPVTVMAFAGGTIGAAAQHSDFPVGQLVSCGGIKVVCPSCPADAKGLLQAAIRDPNPVVFFAHWGLGNLREEVPEDSGPTPLSQGSVVREGRDLTLVGWSLMARRAIAAAEQLEGEISVEVVDPRTVHPLDFETIARSVDRTGRLVVVDESRQSCSAGRDIIARVCSERFEALQAPPRLVANPDVHIPAAKVLENAVIPGVDAIVDAVRLACSPEVVTD
jgi:acetoin:2,6-dichlorophenolindophenol oxidoreductase subunit beta